MKRHNVNSKMHVKIYSTFDYTKLMTYESLIVSHDAFVHYRSGSRLNTRVYNGHLSQIYIKMDIIHTIRYIYTRALYIDQNIVYRLEQNRTHIILILTNNLQLICHLIIHQNKTFYVRYSDVVNSHYNSKLPENIFLHIQIDHLIYLYE